MTLTMNHLASTSPAKAKSADFEDTQPGDLTSQTHKTKKPLSKRAPQVFIPLADETRYSLDTAAAAHQLNRKSQTLRYWASTQSGPIRPMLINGRLAWPCAELRRVLGVAA